jgi:competence ComEA-like helix-hairpin-helix protein
MRKPSVTGTHWFSLSGRELLLLAAGVAIALLVVGLIQLMDALRPRDNVSVGGTPEALALPKRMDVNTAADYELEMLPGIGPKTAKAIIQYREQHGPFATLEDLEKVNGIGPKTIEAIRPHAMCVPVRREQDRRGD